MLSRKRPLFNGYGNEPLLCTKKCLVSLEALLDRCQAGRLDRGRLRTNCGRSCKLTDTNNFSELLSSWADTQKSVENVLEHLKSRQANNDIFLNDLVNEKFSEFHRDITEECGADDKQHSWAVIEKPEEVVMYGPYYPNYNNGEHSEDIIIKQTQELLELEVVGEDWRVYVFTMNSPCLARNTDPCMLNLVQKAQEWWRVYGVKTHIGYVKCWGFKGTKENLFKDIDYRQVECISQSEDFESYLKAAGKITDFNTLSETLFSVVKHLLGSVSFPSINTLQGQDWESHFKSMHSIFPEDKKESVAHEVNAVIEAALALLSEKSTSVEECLEKGRVFALDYNFSSEVPDAVQDQIRLTFQQCWEEMVQDKYSEFIRDMLTEDFNQTTVQLFIKDVVKFSKLFLQIGRIQFSEDNSKGPNVV